MRQRKSSTYSICIHQRSMGAKVRVILLVCTPCVSVASREQQKCNSSFCWAHTEWARKIAFFLQRQQQICLVRARSFAHSLALAHSPSLLYGNSGLWINLLQIHFGAPTAPWNKYIQNWGCGVKRKYWERRVWLPLYIYNHLLINEASLDHYIL
jgi:hypothetical protein